MGANESKSDDAEGYGLKEEENEVLVFAKENVVNATYEQICSHSKFPHQNPIIVNIIYNY